MTAGGRAVVTVVAALVGMIMGMIVAVQMIVGVGMLVVMCVAVGVFVGMGNTVMGMLVGMGMVVAVAVTAYMIVIDMHGDISFIFFFYYTRKEPQCQRKSMAYSVGVYVKERTSPVLLSVTMVTVAMRCRVSSLEAGVFL